MKWPTPLRHKAMENVMEREEKMQFAVLIDAENVSARYVQVIFDELEKYPDKGTVHPEIPVCPNLRSTHL